VDTAASHDYAKICDTLRARLRLRADPIALKLFESVEAMQAVPGVRRPEAGVHFSMCQLIGQVRWLGFTLGITHDNVVKDSNCGGVVGLNVPATKYLDGSMFKDVWFATVEASREHQAQMPRVAAGKYHALVASPLAKARLDPPDSVLIYATPGQMMLIVNALQHRNYFRADFTVTGETACADSWGRGLSTGKPSISIPCFAERRFGGVQDDELLVSLRMEHVLEVITGLDWLSAHGIRYPIAPYGVQCDPAAAFKASYDGKL
jgi:uncharacterized protein (DUF169 family)